MGQGEPASSWRTAVAYGSGSALVAVFSYVTASWIPLVKDAYWAPIAAVVVLYPERKATWTAGGERFVGTAIGSLLGWATASSWHHNALVYAAAVFLVVGSCYVLRLPTASRLGAVAVSVITLIPRPESPHLVALSRFVEVSYGIACAMMYTAAVDAITTRRIRKTT